VGWAFIATLAPHHPDLGICVADDLQGRGIGTKLIEQVLQTAKLRAMSPLYLMVVKDNERARHWYERYGFAVCGDEYDENDQLDYFHMLMRSHD
jgi:ribosomal protein S18 acetylase RimI-like enzyme